MLSLKHWMCFSKLSLCPCFRPIQNTCQQCNSYGSEVSGENTLSSLPMKIPLWQKISLREDDITY